MNGRNLLTRKQLTHGSRKLVATELDQLQTIFWCSLKIDFIDIVSADGVYLDWHVVSKNITNIQLLFYPDHIHIYLTNDTTISAWIHSAINLQKHLAHDPSLHWHFCCSLTCAKNNDKRWQLLLLLWQREMYVITLTFVWNTRKRQNLSGNVCQNV